MTSEFPLEKLGKFVSVKSGFPFSSNDMGDVGAPIIKIGNITPPKIDINNVQRISFKKISEDPRIQKFALEKGDILIALTGATVGKMGRMPQTKEVFYLNQRVGKIFFHNQIQIDRDFIYYALSQENNIEMMFGFADGSAQANLSGAQIESIEIPFPPISEQTKIAGILGALDKQIELNNLMNATLESIASVVFKSWFVDFDPVGAKIKANLPSKMAIEIAATFPSGFQSSDHGEIPEGWASLKWGDIAILEYGKALIGYKFANAPYKVYGTNGAIRYVSMV
jgi:type I restriction enzyme S subunit